MDNSILCHLYQGNEDLPLPAYQPPSFNTYAGASADAMPWFLTYFNSILEAKFQPLVLENPDMAITATHTLFKGPSYNIDKFTLTLVSQFGHLSELMINYPWLTPKLDPVKTFPSTGNPLPTIKTLGSE